MNQEEANLITEVEKLRHTPKDILRSSLLTWDGVGPKAKEIALNELIRRAKEEATAHLEDDLK